MIQREARRVESKQRKALGLLALTARPAQSSVLNSIHSALWPLIVADANNTQK
jgi:hypothetical protein